MKTPLQIKVYKTFHYFEVCIYLSHLLAKQNFLTYIAYCKYEIVSIDEPCFDVYEDTLTD